MHAWLLVFFCWGLAASGVAGADGPARSYAIQTVAGTDVTLDGGSALAAVLSQTEGIAVDRLGNIYVADADDNRVRKIMPDGTIRTVAGTGAAGFSGDGGAATAALLNRPYGLALDAAGNLYIADLGNARIRRVAADASIQTVAGGGSIPAGANSAGIPAVMVQFTSPRNIALAPDGTLYLSDFGAHRVYQISAGGILNILAGTGKLGFSGEGAMAVAAQLNSPAGIAYDPSGDVYFADSGNNRIRKVSRGVIATVYNVTAPTGVALGLSGSLYIAAANYLGTAFRAIGGIPAARDVTVDRFGTVYASTGVFVRKVTADGKAFTVAGSGASRYFGGDNGPAGAAKLHTPSGLAVDDAGNFYVADTANHRIRKIDPGGIITTVAGTGVPGSLGDAGPATLAQLNGPTSVAIDSQHNLFIADTGNNKVRKITPGGVMLLVADKLNDPESVSVDLDGAVYIADAGNNRVLKVTGAGVVSTVAQVLMPAAVTLDRTGNVLVSELTRISKITPAGIVTTVLDGLNSPRGLALTEDGDLFIAEPGVHVIRRLSPSGALSIVAGTGMPSFSGDGGPATMAQLNGPSSIVADLTGTLWFTDSGNNRIRKLTPFVAADIISPVTVVHAATLGPGPIAPGEIITVFGSGFDPNQTQLLFDGKPATIFYAGTGQINALAPLDLAPNSITAISVTVKGAAVAGAPADVVSALPGIFTIANGTGQAAAINEDGSLNSVSSPVARGSIIVLYATGEGRQVSTVSLKIAGYAAEVLYAGPAPGFPGLMQINARVPGGFAPTGILPVVLLVGSASSQDGVTIAVR